MRIFWFQICVIVSVLAGAMVVTQLSEVGLALFAGGSLGLCAILGWFLTFQNKAVKLSHGFLWTLFGNLQPIPSKWVKPLGISWAERIIVLVVSMLFGACIRIFWIVNA